MYDIEITVDDSTVTFRDAAGTCGDQSLPETIGTSGPLYVYVGRDTNDYYYYDDDDGVDAIWHSVEVCPVRETSAPTAVPTTPAPSTTTPAPTVPCVCDQTLVVGVLTDIYPGETTWKVTLDEDALDNCVRFSNCADEDDDHTFYYYDYDNDGRCGPYQEQLTLQTKEVTVCAGQTYTFEIFDSYGDGTTRLPRP